MKIIRNLLVAASLLAASGLAFAAPDHHHGRGDHGHDRRHDRDRHEWRHDRGRHEGWRHDRGHRYVDYRHGHHWERGHRYYGPTYVVRNYGYYRLRPPPRGYHWVRADNDYLLVAIATGIILDMAIR